MIDVPLHAPRTYVRREGRITRAQRRALLELWPKYGLETNAGALDFAHHFGRQAPVILEIGFGSGEALLELAERDPATNYLGIEVYRPGIGHLLLQLAARGIDNVRVIEGDAREVLAHCVSPGSLHAVYLLFPDPWPKKRHHKRRLLQAPFLELLRGRLEVGARVHIATDWEDYARSVRSAVASVPGLVAGRHARGRLRAPGTRFERRGRALGHRIWRIVLERVV